MTQPRYTPADRDLDRALLFNFLIHGAALLTMAAFLLPALPGGAGIPDASRIEYIARHPWLFRLGWLPWQLCALADLLLAVAMVRVAWLSRAGSIAVLALTVCAVIPDQYAEFAWVTRGVTLAQSGNATAYLAFERSIFPLTAGWGALFYTLAALGWTWCFARAGTWSRLLSLLSVLLWSAMFLAATSPLLPIAIRPSSATIAAVNAVAFAMLQLWLGLVAEEVFRRHRPYESHGRLARWRHPSNHVLARLADLVANSRLLGAILEPLPEFAMVSDIRDVVYVNYLVPAERLLSLVPHGLELQRLGPNGEYALFTFLTFRHGHFGFRVMGPLRRLMPSPVQSNWRIHVRDPRTGTLGIYFVTNAVTAVGAAFPARLLTEGMPMHVLRAGDVTRADDGALHVSLDPGAGSAPDADVKLRPADALAFPDDTWRACWSDYRAFLAYCVPQDRAMSTQPLRARISRQEIQLGIPLDACEPMTGTVISRAAHAIVGDAPPFCFRVAAVQFRFIAEAHDSMRDAA